MFQQVPPQESKPSRG